jgi:hypothetical protein
MALAMTELTDARIYVWINLMLQHEEIKNNKPVWL